MIVMRASFLNYGATSVLKTITSRSFSATSYHFSKNWAERHTTDPYVKASVRLNYRARSAFKLLAIDEKFKIFAPGQIVIDCGASPGSWAQVAIQKLRGSPDKKAYTVRQLIQKANAPIGFSETEISDFRSSPHSGFLVGFDLSPILPIKGASFLSNADIFDASTPDRISRLLLQHQKLLEETDAESPNSFSVDEAIDSLAASLTPPRCVDVVMSDMAPNATGQFSHDVLNICRLARGAYDLVAVFLKPEGSFIFKLWDSGPAVKAILEQLGSRFSSVKIFKPEGSRAESAEIFIVCRGFKVPAGEAK